MDEELNYEALRDKASRYYHQIGKIICPALENEYVHFTSAGFKHLIFKGNFSKRNKKEQIARFKLLPLAVRMVRLATIYQEIDQAIQKITDEEKLVYYWCLAGILDKRKIKVIIRQVGENEPKHFWSVIPDWISNKRRDIKFAATMEADETGD